LTTWSRDAPRRAEDGLQILEHLARLLGDALGELARSHVDRDLPRHEDEVTRPDGLGVGADGRRGAGGGDHLDGAAHNRTPALPNVSQARSSPVCIPVLNHDTRWALEPWVKLSGTT
jgi:hypothetical protein